LSERSIRRSTTTFGVAAVALAAAATMTAGVRGTAARTVPSDTVARVPAETAAAKPRRAPLAGALDSLVGLSGKLRARFVAPAQPELRYLGSLLAGTAASRPGVYALDSLAGRPFSVITMRPFSDKVNGRIGRYRIGRWPFEGRGAPRTAAYRNPSGFIEVTKENQDTYVSEHFRLRDFLTKDQFDVWPKYLVLDEQLLDKLELVIDELRGDGYDVRRLAVMSGFRTPQYNAPGVGAGGRAATSRHQYGDAADVFVDNDGDGWTDDVNRDGRVDVRDARLVAEAAARVERAHPKLVGGIGLYTATSAHGPFTHIDARGNRARWGGAA
jgi:hypothetical protein